ncbi:hypothetical protein ECBG_04213 [Enterococcus casseliflavus EC20]|uniref:ABC transporter substrate-binding protein n=1 Tax=Enterococcus casseliflavus EC20 TaxID=565655 RepID=M9TC89_ENTCA|nr:ABC transporter substrate-binding protein [Enterococcus casseliflavus]AGJ01166.1 hypothetical protein ECBG_04213 [Enterococcus casseliflavus EC20]
MKLGKIGPVVGIGLLSCLMLTSCGKKQAEDSENVTIRMSWWGNDERHKATLAAIEKFEQKYSYIKVKAEYSGFDGVEQKIATQMTGNTEPDLMQMKKATMIYQR